MRIYSSTYNYIDNDQARLGNPYRLLGRLQSPLIVFLWKNHLQMWDGVLTLLYCCSRPCGAAHVISKVWHSKHSGTSLFLFLPGYLFKIMHAFNFGNKTFKEVVCLYSYICELRFWYTCRIGSSNITKVHSFIWILFR